MKKGYYICGKASKEFTGVDKKIDNQIKAMNLYFDCQKLVIYREKYQLIKSIIWRMPFGSFGRQYEKAWEQIDDPDFFYIRFMLVDRKFLKFIKELRERFPKCKILMEIPTYPYVHEWKSAPSMVPFYIKDMWYHRYLKKYINKIVTFTDDERIFDIPTIRTMNGIWMDNIKVARNMDNGDKIILLAVATFSRHHGYERCIEGLNNYYSKGGDRQIEIHMVGDGNELLKYRNLVKKYHLEKYVIFHGRKVGKELDAYYDMADIALGSFGLYKIKAKKSSNLKVREYLAKGLPIVSGCREDAFENNSIDFYYGISNDSTPLDVEQIIHFYDKLYKGENSREEVSRQIREYGENTVDMKVSIKPVVDYINK